MATEKNHWLRRDPKKIEIIRVEHNYYTVCVDDLFATKLCIDEVMGCVASALFATPLERAMFCKTYAEWDLQDRRYRTEEFKPIALLTTNSCRR